MQKLPIVVALTMLGVAVGVARTQENEKNSSNVLPAKATDVYQPSVPLQNKSAAVAQGDFQFRGTTKTPFIITPEQRRRAEEAMAPFNSAWREAGDLMREGRLREAEIQCRRAIALAHVSTGVNTPPHHGSEVRLLGDIQLTQGKYREALENYGANDPYSMRHIPGYPELCLRIAQCYVGLNDFKTALKFYNYATQGDSKRSTELPGAGDIRSLEATLLFMRGIEVSGWGEYPLTFYRAAEKLAPTNWFIAHRIGDALYFLERYDEAIPYYRRAMQYGGDKVPYYQRTRVEMFDLRQKQQNQQAPK